jgi:hypothetical protein
MSSIQKIESSYLQFLRIVFLLFATAAIAIALVMSIRFLIGHNAKPEQVDGSIELKLDSYRPVAAKDENVEVKKVEASEKDKLLEDFINIIDGNGKKFDQNWTTNKELVARYFKRMEADANLGRPFLVQLMPVLDAGLKRTDVTDGIKKGQKNYADEVGSLIEHFKGEYKRQASDIQAKEQAASLAAVMKQASAWSSLYTAGILFGAFIGLVLLIVLLKIERNLRGSDGLVKA